MLEAEIDTHLDYEKHDTMKKKTSNSRNGKGKKSIISEYGEQEINLTNKIVLMIKEWQNRPLQHTFAVVFPDATHFKVKQDGAIVNKVAYMVIDIDLDGNKDVLGIWIGENESSKFWLSVLNDLKNRGVQDILII